jgi:hypothetical protein
MLIISPAVTVSGVPGAFSKNDYVLFPDSENKNLYYALAERPTFQADSEGNPNFNLTWYFGSGVTPGAVCTLSVALPAPDMRNPEVNAIIASALTKDQATRKIAQSTFDLCKAMDEKDAAKASALRATLGFSEATADQKKAIFDKTRSWEQFLPAVGDLDVRPIPFKSGAVTVQAFADKDAYQDGTPAVTTGRLDVIPSYVNGNAAVVTFNLKELGANLFWHGFGGWRCDQATPRPPAYDEAKGGSSVIAVTYRVWFDGLLPSAKATVTLDREIVAKLDVVEEVRKGAWGGTYKKEKARGKAYDEAINNSTDIVLPAVASKEEQKQVQTLLTDWAAKQLEEMVASQLPAVKLDDLNIEGARKLATVSKQSRTYKLTQAVTLPKYPQAQLPKIDGIVKQDKLLRKFFQLINLNEKPYFDVDVTVAPPSVSYLKDRKVDRFVVTQIGYGNDRLRGDDNKEVSTLEFLTKVEQPTPKTLRGTFDLNTQKFLEYSYLVAYDDGTPPYRVTSVKQTGADDKYLALSGVDIGVLSVTLSGIDLPWDVISSAKVDLKYGDWTKTIALKNGESTKVVQPFGRTMTEALTYKLTMNPKVGAPHVGPETTAKLIRGDADITLQNTLGDVLYTIHFDLGDGVTKAQLRVEYRMKSSGPDRVFSQMIQLDASKPDVAAFDWKVPAFSSYPPSFRVTKARVTADGATKDLTDLSGSVLDPVDQDAVITVLADSISTF